MPKTILIVEDTPETLALLKVLLESEAYGVVGAETGEDALRIIESEHIDLVILDIMLPRVDGFEVCRRIKSNPKNRGVPVIAVTAFDVPNIVQMCKAAGADDVVLKPFDNQALLNKVKNLIKD